MLQYTQQFFTMPEKDQKNLFRPSLVEERNEFDRLKKFATQKLSIEEIERFHEKSYFGGSLVDLYMNMLMTVREAEMMR